MRRSYAILGSFVFLLIAPGFFAGVVPWWITRWQLQPPLLGIVSLRVLGALLIAAGIRPLLDSFARFALQGLGTPAPVFPTKHLVVTGFYRHLRNPMYVGVTAVIFGQGLLFGRFWLCTYVFVLLSEETKLTRSFGDEYREFRNNVPRWIPRLSPWHKNHPNGWKARRAHYGSAFAFSSSLVFVSRRRRPRSPAAPRCSPAMLPSRSMTT